MILAKFKQHSPKVLEALAARPGGASIDDLRADVGVNRSTLAEVLAPLVVSGEVTETIVHTGKPGPMPCIYKLSLAVTPKE